MRHLERQIATICRKAARRAAEGDESRIAITARTLARYLGPPPYIWEQARTIGEIGVANGLAWTESGGEVLTLEATMTRGTGLMLTGQLGDVMKESGQAALTYARCCSADLGFDEAIFARHEVHLHIPAGAIPKDGPSAGIAIATAIISLATRTRVRHDVAMTGEVTLRGRVLPVGGVRREGARGAALRHQQGDPAAQEPERSAGSPAGAEAQDPVHPGRSHGRGAGGGARAGAAAAQRAAALVARDRLHAGGFREAPLAALTPGRPAPRRGPVQPAVRSR